jgi:hypothetical protein
MGLTSLNKLQILIYNTLRGCVSCHMCNTRVKSFHAGMAAWNRLSWLFRLQEKVGRIWLPIKCNSGWSWPTVDLFSLSCSAVNCVFKSSFIVYSGTYLQRNRNGPIFLFSLQAGSDYTGIWSLDYTKCMMFPLKTGFRCAWLPFKTGFIVVSSCLEPLARATTCSSQWLQRAWSRHLYRIWGNYVYVRHFSLPAVERTEDSQSLRP